MLAVALCASVLAALPTIGSGASTGSSVVGATVVPSISLQDGCTHAAATSFGTVTVNSSSLTATGANVCRFTFGSSNSSSMLRMYQADRTTQAMVARPTTWSWRSSGNGTFDLADGGPTLLLAQDPWHVGGRYLRSVDGGGTWSTFVPADSSTLRIAAVSSTVAWRFGNGFVARSTDMQAATPTWTSLGVTKQGGGVVETVGADAIDANVAWVSHYGGVYRTADAGATAWSVGAPPCVNPGAIDATSASTAFVIGWGGAICRTIDANVTWTSVNTGLPAGFDASDIQGSPQSITTIWTVGSRGRVARSTDNGSTWNLTPAATPIPIDLTAIDVLSDTEAVVGGIDGLMFRTTDGGTSWTRVRAPITGPVSTIVSPNASIMTVSVHAGSVHTTANAAATWSTVVDGSDRYRDLDAIDTSALVAAMSNGRVATSTDDGATMTPRSLGWASARNARGVAVIDASSFVAVGDQGSIATTEDGGATWTQRASGTTEDLWDVDVTSEGIAIAVGASGTILRSSDGGRNWTTRSAAGDDLRRIDIRSGTPAIAVGLNGAIRRSADGGVTWTSPASGTTGHLDSVSVASDLVMYASHVGTLLTSTDGGLTWSSRGIGGMARVDAVSANMIWLTTAHVGGWTEWANVSIDGGATFTAPFGNHDPDVASIHALDGGRIYFTGNGGKLRVTDPPSTVADYAAGGWAGAGSLFGACLQDLGGASTVAAWIEDVSGSCTANDTDNWYPVPTAPVKVAQMAGAGTGTVDVVWGFKAAGNAAPSTYAAGVVVEAIAPNA